MHLKLKKKRILSSFVREFISKFLKEKSIFKNLKKQKFKKKLILIF